MLLFYSNNRNKANLTNFFRYHYLQSEKKYKEEIVLPELEKYKEGLKKKKEQYKPIDPYEIKEHEKKYQKYLKEKLEEK